ncbi:hypothetical protein G6F32_015863 [Rhizopus arrhizus]|nr:hypothetical protein G6F32_015863 [Rhizopus arrhizus]
MFTFLTVVPPLLPAFGIAPDIVPGATAFLHAVRWGGPALTLYFCIRYLSEGMHWTLPTMLLGFGGLLVLAPMGYVLANGKLGFPEMGAEGLGIASAVMICSRTSKGRAGRRSGNCCAPACRSVSPC